MRVLTLSNPYCNGFKNEDDPVAVAYLDQLKEVHAALNAGTLYCRFIDGDRKGSIARLEPEPGCVNNEPGIRWFNSYSKQFNWKFERDYFSTICRWDKRKNKVKLFLPHRDAELLLDYNGPTVWQKFDANAAKQEALANPNQCDIDGNLLEINDNVLFINARYGARMVLSFGRIAEFKAVANSYGTTITTIIESEAGEKSELLYPEDMVYKL